MSLGLLAIVASGGCAPGTGEAGRDGSARHPDRSGDAEAGRGRHTDAGRDREVRL